MIFAAGCLQTRHIYLAYMVAVRLNSPIVHYKIPAAESIHGSASRSNNAPEPGRGACCAESASPTTRPSMATTEDAPNSKASSSSKRPRTSSSTATSAVTRDALGRRHRPARLIIIDEFGYMPGDEEGSRLLFQIISDSYETRSIIYTTNIESGGWGRALSDANMAAVLIDRTVHRGRRIRFQGESYRSQHALMTK